MPDVALATARATRVPGRPELADMAIHHSQSTLRPPPRRIGDRAPKGYCEVSRSVLGRDDCRMRGTAIWFASLAAIGQ